MSKKLLSVMLCSLLFFGGMTGVVSCKDYDDDISNINTTTDGLSKQIASLQDALKVANDEAASAAADAQSAISAAQQASKDADDAAAAAANAAAEAAIAKQAAAQAKAEAISELVALLEKAKAESSAAINKNAEDIAALAGRIDGIEKGLLNIDLTDINKQLGDQAELIKSYGEQLQTIETQLKALENFKTSINEQLGSVPEIKAKLEKIATIESDLKTLQGKVSANEKAINEIKEQLSTISGQISTEVSNAVNTIAGTMSRRLTSVTLMPDLYVDGIPTITFESAKYIKKELKNGQWVPSTAAKREFIISNNSATAQYRLNPATVGEEDVIKSRLAYVSRIATSRAGEVLNDIVNVADSKISDNGILTVKLGKGNTESLNLSNNKIYTVSLKVPIAEKHLFTDNGETEAAVYSEFTRLEETYFTPELAFVKGQNVAGTNSHLYDSTAVYNSNAGDVIAKYLVYNQSYDLYKLVEGCKLIGTEHTNIDRETLQGYGLDIIFHVANKEYAPTEDKTNQQAFVKLGGENNSTLTPVSSSGQEGNQVIIGKQPIIAATLVDKVNGNVVEQKYFKVCFAAEEMEDVTIDWPLITSNGAPCTGARYDFTWKSMAEYVLEHLNDNAGMSKEDFTKIYGVVAPTIDPANDDNGTIEVNVVASNIDASIPVMTWSLTAAQLGNLKEGDNSISVEKTVTFTDPTALHPNIVINLEWTVNTTVGKVTLGSTDGLKWQNNTMKVYPVPMVIPYDGEQKAEYKTNILEGRTKPYVNGLLACGQYDIDYSTSNTLPYLGEALSFPNGYGHWILNTSNQAKLDEIYYSIANSAAGKNLVSNGGIVKIDWSANVNGNSNSRYVFGTTNLQIVKILTLNTVLAEGFIDNSREQTIDIADKYSLRDAYGNLVAASRPASAVSESDDGYYAEDYYKFYGIQDAKFGSDIKVADNAEGTQNVRTLESLNMTANLSADGDLTFQNNGAPLQANAYLIVPVTVEHLWGTLEGTIAVPLNKSTAPLNKR